MWQNSTRIEQGNKLSFDNISPCGRVPLGLSKATNCLLTISVHVTEFVLLQRLNHSGWLRPGKESSAVRKGPAFQVILAPLWPEPADPASFILSRSHDNYIMVTWQLCKCIVIWQLCNHMIGVWSHDSVLQRLQCWDQNEVLLIFSMFKVTFACHVFHAWLFIAFGLVFLVFVVWFRGHYFL